MGRGSLVIVLGFMIISGLVVASIREGAMESLDNAIAVFDQMMANNVANSGVNLCLRRLKENRFWRAGYDGDPLLGGELTAELVDPGMDPQVPEHGLRLTSIGRFGRATAQARVNMIRPAFCQYLYFTDYEPTIWFITGDVLDGPVHTNGTLHINGSPTFMGRVTSPHPYIGRNNPNPIMMAGSNLAHATVELPTDLSDLAYAAAHGGLRWTRTKYLTFQADGTVLSANRASGPWTTHDLSAINGAIYTTRNFYVKGTVHGQVTVVAQRYIYILDDIVYAEDPRENPDSQDMLGLIAGRNVYVKDTPENRNDCVIHAAIMALNSSFTVQNYRYPPPRGTLSILGSVVQDRRGPVGTFTWRGIRSGYRKDYQYDVRFRSQAPPYFPRANFYQVVSWAS